MKQQKPNMDFTPRETAGLLDMQPGNFQHWLNRYEGMPFHSVKQGKRSRRMFTFENIRRLAIIREIRQVGFELSAASEIAREVDHWLTRGRLQYLVVYRDGDTGQWKADTAEGLQRPWEAYIVVNLVAVRKVAMGVASRAAAAMQERAPEDRSDRYTLLVPADPETGEPVAEQAVVVPGHDKAAAAPAATAAAKPARKAPTVTYSREFTGPAKPQAEYVTVTLYKPAPAQPEFAHVVEAEKITEPERTVMVKRTRKANK